MTNVLQFKNYNNLWICVRGRKSDSNLIKYKFLHLGPYFLILTSPMLVQTLHFSILITQEHT